MNREIAIVSVGMTEMTIIEPMKEPNVIKFHIGINFSRTPINTVLREELTRLYNDGYKIETSNEASSGIQTYILAK